MRIDKDNRGIVVLSGVPIHGAKVLNLCLFRFTLKNCDFSQYHYFLAEMSLVLNKFVLGRLIIVDLLYNSGT
jgi:hypothetical protein